MICKSKNPWHAGQKLKLSPLATGNDVPIEGKAWGNHVASIFQKTEESEKFKNCGIGVMRLTILDTLKK